MISHHAVEIALTRPATDDELCRARRVVALASDTSRTRLLALQRAKTPGRAVRALRQRLKAVLPIDVLTTHYPDQQGRVLLNVALSPSTQTTVRQAAAAHGQRPRDFLSQAVTDAVARHREKRARHLTSRLEELLGEHTPEELLLCAARTLLSRPHRRPSGTCASAPS
ncbi:hypothetical protein ACQF36_26065 [Streptomyces sp. Marseille-Q5077]|uniref:hypothetical protein n=1 Tax=Streptomyces sp. Marseille-Q5077 TaxID=3418995 RepID=UPI003CFE00CE